MLRTVNLKDYFHLQILDPLFKCISNRFRVQAKKSSLKYYFEELCQHLHIILLKVPLSLKLFINESPLNNAIFIIYSR